MLVNTIATVLLNDMVLCVTSHILLGFCMKWPTTALLGIYYIYCWPRFLLDYTRPGNSFAINRSAVQCPHL